MTSSVNFPDLPDFHKFCDFLQNESGITISPSKSYLVSARVRHIMLDYGFTELSELTAELYKRNSTLKQRTIDAMTTNETFWFRDEYPYEYFTNSLLPLWNSKEHKESRVKIWSAACSSGQEPYSLSMLVEEYKAKKGTSKPIDIVATDLSNDILDKAKKGSYDKLCIARGLSSARLGKFFTEDANQQWNINKSLKNSIQFKSMNLLEPYSSLDTLDIIFCRNVLIYFTADTKTDILRRMHDCLKPNGLLCLGASESLAGASDLFSMEHCKPGIMYRKVIKPQVR